MNAADLLAFAARAEALAAEARALAAAVEADDSGRRPATGADLSQFIVGYKNAANFVGFGETAESIRAAANNGHLSREWLDIGGGRQRIAFRLDVLERRRAYRELAHPSRASTGPARPSPPQPASNSPAKRADFGV